jgi:branched-chain amino acid aminotransferase
MGIDSTRERELISASGDHVWLNGEFLPEQAAKVSLFDRGYLYGDGLFETMRAYSGRVFRLAHHLARLRQAAAQIGLQIPFGDSQIQHIVKELLIINRLQDAYIRLNISRGIGLGPLPDNSQSPTVSLIAKPLRLPSPKKYENGWQGIVVRTGLSPEGGLSQLKTLSYLDKIMAKMKAQEAGVQEAILVNANDEITEASTSNIFLVKDSLLLTPPVEAGLLPGITRLTILEMASKVEERRILASEIFEAEECFITNSIIEIMPLTRLEGKKIGDGRPGKVTMALQQAYTQLVRNELGLS